MLVFVIYDKANNLMQKVAINQPYIYTVHDTLTVYLVA